MKNSERELFLSQNPHIEQVLVSLTIGRADEFSHTKLDNTFRDKLKEIKKTNSGTFQTPNLGEI